MNCPRCGEISDEGCNCDLQSAFSAGSENAVDVGADPVRADPLKADAVDTDPVGNEPPVPEAAHAERAWRDELSDRLSRYRARRKMRPPRYPSLRLPFEAAFSPSDRDRSAHESTWSREPIAESSLALDPSGPIRARDETVQPETPRNEVSRSAESKSGPAKIIEFPRFAWAPPPPPPDQLAEPVIDRPRILEVPEVAPPPPALGGITIEPVEVQELEKRPGIDFPLQSASLPRRMFAGLIDGLMVVAATALFGLIFWKLTHLRPPIIHIATLAIAVLCLSWAAYQYLLTVHSGRTLGLMAARLELARFDGTPANRKLRRWRVLASYLSAASIAMGYAWVFLDEDTLCWHDRITHTYLAAKRKPTKE